MLLTKTKKIALIAAGSVLAVFALAWFFQSQGILKVFPTAQDRELSRALRYDESKFRPAVGVPDGDFQKEIEELRRRHERVSKNRAEADAWFRYGYQLSYLNDHEGAVRAWDIALKLQPLNFQVATNMANALQYFIKDYPRAEEYYLKALDVQPAYTSAWQGLADLYRFNWKEKQPLLEKAMLLAIENDPNGQSAYLSTLIGFYVEQQPDLARARDYLSRLRAVNPSAADEQVETYPILR